MALPNVNCADKTPEFTSYFQDVSKCHEDKLKFRGCQTADLQDLPVSAAMYFSCFSNKTILLECLFV